MLVVKSSRLPSLYRNKPITVYRRNYNQDNSDGNLMLSRTKLERLIQKATKNATLAHQNVVEGQQLLNEINAMKDSNPLIFNLNIGFTVLTSYLAYVTDFYPFVLTGAVLWLDYYFDNNRLKKLEVFYDEHKNSEKLYPTDLDSLLNRLEKD